MAERTEPIRQDIDATRASMTETLEQIEGQVRGKVDQTVSQARRAIDVQHHMSERPWLMMGLAITAGFVLGSMGSDDDSSPQYPRSSGQPMRYYDYDDNDSSSSRLRSERYASSSYSDRNGNDSERSFSSDNNQRWNESTHDRGHSGQRREKVAQFTEPLREELTMIASAAMRSAMRALRESLHDSIPQFESEYRQVERERHGDHDQNQYGTQARAVGGMSGMSDSSSTGSSGLTGNTGLTGSSSGLSGSSSSTGATINRPEHSRGLAGEESFRNNQGE